MNSSDQNTALPTWIFIATDLALIGAAAFIALQSPHPLPASATIWIVACVGLGAIVGLVPLLVRYERQKNAVLDERQSALESLARTINSSAEQISIAANGLHEIGEMAHKNLRLAEQLPHKLQDKIAEFQAQLAATVDTEKEELERELLALRTSESERLESVSQRIAKSSADWTKLEAATHQHLTAANEAIAKLAFGTAGAIGKAQAAAEQALSQARVEAARALGDAGGNAARAIESAKSSALVDLEARLATASALLVERVTAELNATLARSSRPPNAVSSSPETTANEPTTPISTAAGAPHADAAASTPPESVASTPLPEPTKRPRPEVPLAHARSYKRERVAAGRANPAPETAAATDTPAPPAEAVEPASVDEPLPVPANSIPEITPVAPVSAEPFSGHIASNPNGNASPVPSEAPNETPAPAAPVETAPVETPKSGRKRAVKKPEEQEEPGLGLELDDTPAGFVSGTTERVLTSDGATRLFVTAYIGIGNRLFIRGDGPGLSWEKGTPLQFVSIGKWRWETNDATAAVRFKLYKNDDLECSALGAQSLDPGHQQEVTAAF